MAKLYIDLSGRAGHAPKWQGDLTDGSSRPQMRYLGADGQTAGGIYSPLRTYGYMSPAPSASTLITANSFSFSDYWYSSYYDSVSGSFYFGENLSGEIWSGDFDTGGVTSATNLKSTFNGPIPGSNVTVTDFEMYQINGVRKLFYAYNNSAGSGGDIGIFTPTADGAMTNNDYTWLSATAAGGFHTSATNPVFMRTSDNGFMYIFDGNAVHKVDGYSTGSSAGRVTANVLTFPFSFNMIDALDWHGHLWICVQTSNPSFVPQGVAAFNENIVGVYVWDRQSTVVNSTDFIPLSGVREIRRIYTSDTGELRMIVISAEGLVQVRKYNGSTFEVLVEAGRNAFPLLKDSFTTMGSMAVWLGFDQNWYAFGKIAPGEKDALYTFGEISTVTGTPNLNTGAILYAYVNIDTAAGNVDNPRQAFFWSVSSGSNHIWYPFFVNHASGQGVSSTSAGNVYTLVKYLPKLATVNYINIMCAPTPTVDTTTNGTVSIYFNQSTAAFKAHTVTRAQTSRGYVSIPIHKPYVNAIQLKISWPTNTIMSTDDFATAYAEVDYTPAANNPTGPASVAK